MEGKDYHEEMERIKEHIEKQEYLEAGKIYASVKEELEKEGREFPEKYKEIRKMVFRGMLEEKKRSDARIDKYNEKLHEAMRKKNNIIMDGIHEVRLHFIPNMKRSLDIFREEHAELYEKPLPPEYHEAVERLENLEKNTEPGAKMLEDLDKAYDYVMTEIEYMNNLLSTKLVIDAKNNEDAELD